MVERFAEFPRAIAMAFALLILALIPSLSQASTITYYHNDLLGSPVVATDMSGKVIWRESYRPYGERLVNDAASASNDVWFAGRREDRSTGLVYMGARYYDPVIGRFVSKDPVGFDEKNVQSFNRYAYANDNPYKYQDPNGKSPLILWALGGYGAGVLADAASQYAAWGGVDWRLALSSSAAMNGAMVGLLGAADGVGLTIGELGGEEAAASAGSAIERGAVSGSRRMQLGNMPPEVVRNAPSEIDGRTYTGHALDQMQNRGITPSVVEDAISTGGARAGNTAAEIRYFDGENNVSVVLDRASGRVVTVRYGD